MQALDEDKLKEAFARVVGWIITDRGAFIKRMTENIEKVFNEQASSVEIESIDKRLEELRGEMAALVKLNLTAGINDEIYGGEYNRILSKMEKLRSKRTGITQTGILRQETLGRVREVAKLLREKNCVTEGVIWDTGRAYSGNKFGASRVCSSRRDWDI